MRSARSTPNIVHLGASGRLRWWRVLGVLTAVGVTVALAVTTFGGPFG